MRVGFLLKRTGTALTANYYNIIIPLGYSLSVCVTVTQFASAPKVNARDDREWLFYIPSPPTPVQYK